MEKLDPNSTAPEYTGRAIPTLDPALKEFSPEKHADPPTEDASKNQDKNSDNQDDNSDNDDKNSDNNGGIAIGRVLGSGSGSVGNNNPSQSSFNEYSLLDEDPNLPLESIDFIEFINNLKEIL